MDLLASLSPVYAEIFLLVMVSVILIVDQLIVNQTKTVTYLLVQFSLLGCSLITVATHQEGIVHLFNNMFVDDMMSDVLKLLTYLSVSMMLVYSRSYLLLRGLFTCEFMALALFATMGMMVMISASNFLSLYLGLELLALSLYAMVALQRDSAVATESAMKYFILGAMASGFLLYGMSMLYGATGSLDVYRIAEVIQHGTPNTTLMVFGLAFIVAGLAFKLGAVPFHMWVPDVYHGAPTAMTMFIGSAPKLAAFAFVMRILVEAMQPLMIHWSGMLMVLAVLSMAVGNITAIAQTNIKRMLAYSTIAHMGFMLLGVLSGSIEGYGSSMFYAVVYVLMSLGGFGMIMLLSREGFEADSLNDFKGLNQRSPWLAFMMLLLMFSMAGVPPTVGFYAKFSVLNAALQAGHIPLVVMAVLFSLIGAFYYLRIVKLMYFDAPESHEKIYIQPDSTLLVSINGLAVLLLGIMPGTLMSVCAVSVQQSLLH
ncbi:MAG: NADH-quinone oxidoreductase subunit NuoN [Gammaproteobacteria bacterium]|nr:NADH-quinone oxidoreductase subunit NuoN [Gammaproteobacteria bacterium]MBU1777369.1 NADH-quinone oxidoreductase subunit NuoN [Gammaproteobacteria bacterium]MBU1967659.1 NADH-quinone oxidoreductase subunit NuoN [Gammaproteobacteria bacterium]